MLPSFSEVVSVSVQASYTFPERHIVCWIKLEIRFDESIYFLFKLIQLIKDVNLRSDGPDLILDIRQMWIALIVLRNKVLVVGVFVSLRALLVFAHRFINFINIE